MFFGAKQKQFGLHVEGDVTDIETGGGEQKEPTIAELKAQMEAMQKQNASMAKEREQLLQIAANVDKIVEERVKGKQSGRKQEEPDDEVDDDVDDEVTAKVVKRVERRVSKANAPMLSAMERLQDQMDAMQFRQLASDMGETPETLAEVEKQYSQMRRGGAVIKWADGSEAPLTRLDVLDLHSGRNVRSEKLKTAPQKQVEGLRAKLLGNAAFENPGSERRTVPGLTLDEKFESKSNKDKVSELEKSLGTVPLM